MTDAPSPAPEPTRRTLRSEMRSIAQLSLPIVISMAAATLIGVVDTIMISPLGTVPLAAASITTSVIIVLYSALYGFVSVIGVRMAEAHGRGSAEALSDATRTGLVVTTLAGVLGAGVMLALKPALPLLGQPPEVIAVIGGYWTAMSLLLIPFTIFYALKGLFDAIDRPWLGVGLAFASVAINVPANLILIHGVGSWEGLGLLGAGLASLFSMIASLLMGLIVWRRDHAAAPSRLVAPRSRAELVIQLREGAAIATGYVGEGGAYAFAGLMMGWFGAVALAANQIVNSVGGVLYMVPMGVAVAVSIRVGQALGAGQPERLNTIGRATLLLIVSWMSLVMLVVLIFAGPVTRALSGDPEVTALATRMFIIIALLQVADGVQGTMLGAARGMTDNGVPVVITLVCYWLVALPMAYLLAFTLGYGPNAIWVGYGIGLAAAATLITRRFFQRSAQMAG